MDVLYVDNDHHIRLFDLRDSDGTGITGATVQATLYESDGVTEVTGVVWPLSLAYDADERAYVGELPAALEVVSGRRYKLNVTAVAVGKQLSVTRTVRAEVRYS